MKRGIKMNRLLDYWVGIPLLNLLALFRRRRTAPLNPQRIGVMCSLGLGDTLLFSAVLQDLQTAFPSAHITHLYTQLNAAAASIIPGADEKLVIELTKPQITIPIIRAQRFDVFLDFTSWPRLTALYTLLSGATYTVGFETPGQHRGCAYDQTAQHKKDLHEVDNFRFLLHNSGLGPNIATCHPPAITVQPPENLPYTDEPDLIVLHLFASGEFSSLRQWSEERWLKLAQRLAQLNTLFLITGAPFDVPRIKPFVERMKAVGLRCEAFVSPDGFRTLTYILRRARLVISVNTGVMHLAAIAGARLVSINGPNCNERWGPLGPTVVGVESPGKGCGYLNLGFEFQSNPTDCMERISVDQVFAAAQDLLHTEVRRNHQTTVAQ